MPGAYAAIAAFVVDPRTYAAAAVNADRIRGLIPCRRFDHDIPGPGNDWRVLMPRLRRSRGYSV